MEHFEEPSRMVSANALTVQVHLFAGLLLILGYVLSAVAG